MNIKSGQHSVELSEVGLMARKTSCVQASFLKREVTELPRQLCVFLCVCVQVHLHIVSTRTSFIHPSIHFSRLSPAALLNDPSDSHWLPALLSGTVGLTVCVCECSCVCMACPSPRPPPPPPHPPPYVFLFGTQPRSDPVPVSPPASRFLPFLPPRLLRSRQLSLPTRRSAPPPLPLPLSRRPSLPLPLPAATAAAACGVNCHKACRGRLAVECRKRTKSISHETPPALQARSYSFPPPANTPPSLQNTGEDRDSVKWFGFIILF